MEELRFDDLQDINGGSNLSYDIGVWCGRQFKDHKARISPSKNGKKPYKTSLGTVWV